MANDEVLGPRKTMFVLVIVVGCFAVLWPRILSPLILGHTQEQLKPNKFDREAGCCEVIFQTDVAILELVNEVCNSALGVSKPTPQSAAECRKAVNESCGVDIAAFLKRDENVGKSTKKLVEALKNTNSSCLREHFGVPIYSLSPHSPVNSWTLQDSLKQERPLRAMSPHPALRERGRAIPPTAPARQQMPPHVRVRSPLSVYLEIEPPPIPGMRPPLGSPGGPVTAPKSSMGFVMPIYTICIIVFFVYTLSKILFKRTGVPYEPVTPDPQFRRRVFRDDSRTTPDKLGHKEADTRDVEIAALRARLEETERAMQRIVGQLAQRDAESQDNHTRPYTNGTILVNSGPVQIVTSEYQEPKANAELAKSKENLSEHDADKEFTKEPTPITSEEELDISDKEDKPVEAKEAVIKENDEPKELSKQVEEITPKKPESIDVKQDAIVKTEKFLKEERDVATKDGPTTPELLAEALKEDSPVETVDNENSSVKIMGMEVTAHPADGSAMPARPPLASHPPALPAHKAEDVKSIFLETEIPQQSRVLVADFQDTADAQKPTKNAPLVVSGKMTLSLIQDAPRDSPERDPASGKRDVLESTITEYTTASAMTQPAAGKDDDLSEDEIEEEIEEEEEEIEELEEEEEEIELGGNKTGLK
ncbi:eukaryotic translation initiation factor 5B isoform X9 [Colias croceus]|uniref:eukaryotic translation initiation factor 5B isoform X9 n=1 Tax=Colias crocea TaxID=72248 RepID=UPI001E27F5B9|nr:eukaryotic translation initiation factor 5B isoform X9 [Colias croceus]